MADSALLQSLALSGLLHDIGKFRERTGAPAPAARGKYSHEPHSHAFVVSRARAFTQPDRLAAVALGHHDPQLPDERIVAVADRLASAERAETGEEENYATGRTRRPLVSLIARVYGHRTETARIPLGPLEFQRAALFPCASDPDAGSYERLWQAFETETGRITRPDDVETWLYLLQKYTWCMPASARVEEVPDVSLFDHSRATAALAVCLGAAYAEDEPTLNKLLSGPADVPVALLVRMDVRGIQAFLYSLTAKGAAKSLRGRSYYVGLLCEAVVRRVLTALRLPITQVLYAGGGHAYLLLPPDSADSMAALRSELERAIFLLHGGELTISMGWTLLTDSDLRGANLGAKWGEAVQACNADRARPMASQDPQWLAEYLFAPAEQGGIAGRCAVCQAELDQPSADQNTKCPLCGSFEELGRRLLLTTHLALHSVEPETHPQRARSWQEALRALGMQAVLDGSAGTLFRLDGTDFLPDRPSPTNSYGFRPATRVFPKDESGDLLEFGELARRSHGVRRLAALRMDVDNLGMLFREGLSEERLTLSRVAALSSQVRWFFEGYLNTLCDEWPGMVYGLYAGGDDLFFVGAWHVMPHLAHRISQELADYCAGNPKVTVSAGISLFPDKYPLYQAAEDSAEALEASKSARSGRKNAITLLNRTVGWESWPEVITARQRLEAMVQSGGPKTLLQHLRSLQAMSEWDRRQRKIPTQRWRWIAAYLLARMEAMYKMHRGEIEALRVELTDECALSRLALAARWVHLEQRRTTDDGK